MWHQLFSHKEELHERSIHDSVCVRVRAHACVWHHLPHSCLSLVNVMEQCTHTHRLQWWRQLWWMIFMSSLDNSVVMWADSAVCCCLQAVMQWFAYTPHPQPTPGISPWISFYLNTQVYINWHSTYCTHFSEDCVNWVLLVDYSAVLLVEIHK